MLNRKKYKSIKGTKCFQSGCARIGHAHVGDHPYCFNHYGRAKRRKDQKERDSRIRHRHSEREKIIKWQRHLIAVMENTLVNCTINDLKIALECFVIMKKHRGYIMCDKNKIMLTPSVGLAIKVAIWKDVGSQDSNKLIERLDDLRNQVK